MFADRGRGSEREKLQLQAINLGLAEKIVFEGKVVHDHLPEVISSFDVFVALSRVESFGVAVVEAMAVGCPVVVSDAPGFTEIGNRERPALSLNVRIHNKHQRPWKP